jgi:hypothetical protein
VPPNVFDAKMSTEDKKIRFSLPPLSRRNLIVGGGAAVGVAAVAGLAWTAWVDPKNLILWLVDRALPGVTIEPESRDLLARDVLAITDNFFQDDTFTRLSYKAKYQLATGAGEIVGYQALVEQGPLENQFEQITRRAVAMLLTNSNFFYLDDPRSEVIVYTPHEPGTPCTNPLADLSLPDDA